mmetsp:Transcript_11680/g.17139  ORF Transcript_11680/g.17139 Transcript_11680/m.17139 type:complete len:120 (-) Transcript_11680:84-443(-)
MMMKRKTEGDGALNTGLVDDGKEVTLTRVATVSEQWFEPSQQTTEPDTDVVSSIVTPAKPPRRRTHRRQSHLFLGEGNDMFRVELSTPAPVSNQQQKRRKARHMSRQQRPAHGSSRLGF